MEKTVEERLEALEKLQEIDSELDEIRKLRGDLPEEVRDLEDEIVGLETRTAKFTKAIEEKNEIISNLRITIKESKSLIDKYEEQQKNVRNNREFDALTKEIELQSLEIQIAEKKIKQNEADLIQINADLEKSNGIVDGRKKDLESKKHELSALITESEEHEEKLMKKKEKASKAVDERLYNAYERIRSNAKNGLAVVNIKRNACGGCFHTVPPQRQTDVASKKKIIVCENCGRILVDVEVVELVDKSKRRSARKSARA